MSGFVNWIRCAILVGLFILCAPQLCMDVYAVENIDKFDNISGEIEVIFNRREADMQQYIDAFEQKYPEVKVKYTTYSDFESGIKKRMSEGDYGDVLYIPDFIQQNDLSKYFESLGNVPRLSTKYNYVNQGRYVNYSVYGLPSSAYLSGIIYNKSVFDRAGVTSIPTSIDEYLYAMYLINEHTDAIPFFIGYHELWMFQSWESFQFIEMTGNPSYKYGQFITEVEPFREGTVHYKVLRFLYDLVEFGYTEVDRKERISWDQSMKKLNNGEIASMAVGTWALSDIKKADEYGENIGFMPFPNTIDGEQYASLNTDYSYAVAKNSENKDAAKAFLFFMLDESGYAFDHDCISILKSSPYPECYAGMTQTTMRNSLAASAAHYNQYLKLTSKMNLNDNKEYARIVDAAIGKSDETFDEIMEDWNTRWESSREENMIKEIKETKTDDDEVILQVDNRNIQLSANELQYVSEKPILRVGYHKNMSPLSFEIEGHFAGAAYDMCELIAQTTGLQMEYYGYENSAELESALENGEVDIVAGIEKNKDTSSLRYSKEYLNYMEVIVRHSTVNAQSQDTIAVIDGEQAGGAENVREKHYFSNVADGIQNVQDMKVNYMITNYYSANYYVRQQNCLDVAIVPYTQDKTYHIGFSADVSPTLIAICNKCIYSLQKGEMELSLMSYMDIVVKNITLKTFISANPIQSIVILSSLFLIVISAIFWIFYEREKSSRKQALEAQKYEQLAALADESFFEYDLVKKQLFFDTKFQEDFGIEPAVNKNNAGKQMEFVEEFLEQIDCSLEQKKNVQFAVSLLKEDGNRLWYRAITSILYDKKQQPLHMIGKLVNIQKEMEEVETYQNKAHTDALTEVYNREGFILNLPKEAENVTLAVLDMDNFKQVNDSLGHAGGDYALKYLARIIKETLGEKGIVGRYGGDEFVFMLINMSQEDAKKYLSMLVDMMNVEMEFAGNSKWVSISVGAIFSNKMESFDKLFRQADELLYKVKSAGRNSYQLEKYQE